MSSSSQPPLRTFASFPNHSDAQHDSGLGQFGAACLNLTARSQPVSDPPFSTESSKSGHRRAIYEYTPWHTSATSPCLLLQFLLNLSRCSSPVIGLSSVTIRVTGIDIGKNSFHIVGLDDRGTIVLRQKWSRRDKCAPPMGVLSASGRS